MSAMETVPPMYTMDGKIKTAPEIELRVDGYPEKDYQPPIVLQPSLRGAPRGRNWDRTWTCAVIGIAVLAALLVSTIVVFTVVYTKGSDTSPEYDEDGDVVDIPKYPEELDAKKFKDEVHQMATPYTFEDIFDPDLQPKGFSANFIGDASMMVYRDDDGNLVQYNPVNGQTQTIMPNTTFIDLNTGTYYVSWDLSWVLLAYEREELWRYSYHAKYIIYERSTGGLIDFPNDAVLRNQTLQLCRFSSKTNQLGFVYGNNLYYQPSPTSQAMQITTDGDMRNIFNGISEYVYEEEITYTSTAHFFSTNGGNLLYARFDDTALALMTFVKYGDKTNMYPETVQYPYAKPGDFRDGSLGPNPLVSLHVATTSDGITTWTIPPPVEFSGQEFYYKSVQWVDDNLVLIVWKNRVQNESVTMYCDVTAKTCTKNHEVSVAGGWVDDDSNRYFSADGSSYVMVIAEDMGAQGSWLHVAQITLNPTGPGTVTFLSEGAHETRFIVGYDRVREFVYYLDTNGDPTERHLFRVGTTAAAPENRTQVCLTCNVDPGCLYVSAEFSVDGKYYILTCRGPDIPTYILKGLEDGLNLVLEDNSVVSARLAQKLLPTREFITIDVGGGQQGVAVVSYPPGYSGNTSHRLMQNVYGGPDSKEVTKSFPLGGETSNWMTFLQSSHGVVWTEVDGRGTHSNGQDYKYLMYKKMGSVEIEDQVIGANYFKSQSYVDETKKAAIFGWSYGGFSSALSVAYDDTTFGCAISVAPVTHYHFYDTGYTERYQGLATENEQGYNDTDISAKAANFRGKQLMLVHGTADDNVQLMHWMHLARALIDNDVDFRQHLYVDENHGIPLSSRHLYRAFTDFMFNDCWGTQ